VTDRAASDRSGAAKGEAIPRTRYLTFGLLACLGLAADLISKELIFRWRGLPGDKPAVWLIEGYFGIETALNRGALFGLGQGHSWFFAGMSIIAAVAILVWLFYYKMARDAWLNFALGCVMAGILGNLYDRLGLWNHGVVPPEYQTAVRDWVLWSWPGKFLWFQPGNDGLVRWPNFNIADSLLVFAAGMLIVHSFWHSDASASPAAEEKRSSLP
jgi:signal peptidase II